MTWQIYGALLYSHPNQEGYTEALLQIQLLERDLQQDSIQKIVSPCRSYPLWLNLGILKNFKVFADR